MTESAAGAETSIKKHSEVTSSAMGHKYKMLYYHIILAAEQWLILLT